MTFKNLRNESIFLKKAHHCLKIQWNYTWEPRNLSMNSNELCLKTGVFLFLEKKAFLGDKISEKCNHFSKLLSIADKIEYDFLL